MARVLLLALLVVLALPLGVAGAPTSGQLEHSEAASDVAILTLNETSRTSFATPGVDVGTALAAQHDVGAARLDRYVFEERFRKTADTEARQALLLEYATSVEIRIASLRDEERELRSTFASREIDTDTYVRELARLGVRVGEFRASLARIQSHADDIPEFSIRRVQLLDATLIGFEGPIRERVMAAIRADEPPTRLFVSAAESGVVLSTIEDGRHVREAYRSDNRDIGTIGGTGFSEAVDITERIYAPYAYDQSLTVRNELVGPEGGIFQFTMELRQGVVTAYLDGATRNVFFEVQERRVALHEPRPSVVGADNGTRLTVNRTYPGGPLKVAVADNETGTARQVPVIVAGERLETGADGTLWTLGPGAPFEVTAVGPRGNVTVSARPLSPTTLDAEG